MHSSKKPCRNSSQSMSYVLPPDDASAATWKALEDALPTEKVNEAWWNDNLIRNVKIWNPIGIGRKFTMDEVLLGFSIIINYHDHPLLEEYVGSLLFQFVVGTLRIPGRINELLFTTQNCVSLEPKPTFEGFAPANLAAIIRQNEYPEITDDQLRAIIKESSPNISDDDTEKCLHACRLLRGIQFEVSEDEWIKLAWRTESEGREDVGIAFLGYIALIMLRTISKKAGYVASYLKSKAVRNFQSSYKVRTDFSDVGISISVLEKLCIHFEEVRSDRLLVLYSCLSVFHNFDNSLCKPSVQMMLKKCLLKPCAFKRLELMDFVTRVINVYETNMEELACCLRCNLTNEPLNNIYRALVQYTSTVEEKKRLVEENKVEIPVDLLNEGPSPYWQFAWYFDPIGMPQFNVQAAPFLALILGMMIDEKNKSGDTQEMILVHYVFRPFPDYDVHSASYIADWAIFHLSTTKSSNGVQKTGAAGSHGEEDGPSLEFRENNYKLRLGRLRGTTN